MIINLGSRTDIPAFFSEWFYNRVDEGFVCVRNPYYQEQVTKYILDPKVVDCLVFCTKNPQPMLDKLDKISEFGQLWFVTITPYGKDIEPYVPDVNDVLDSFKKLSDAVGAEKIIWRYDPIFVNEGYSIERHIEEFSNMAQKLNGYTQECIISFIDLYEKTKKNFKGVRAVKLFEKEFLAQNFSDIAFRNNMKLKTCAEGVEFAKYGIDIDGCITKKVIERAIAKRLNIPKLSQARQECNCILGNDIGVYNTCRHGCLYCYANYDSVAVKNNLKKHDPTSPFLIGNYQKGFDVVKNAEQFSFVDLQGKLF